MTNIDTPDNQRGFVNAQKLLYAVPANTNNVEVGIPPNAETLIIVAPTATPGNTVEVYGVLSATNYVGGQLLPGGSSIGSGTYVFDISSAVDSTVSITWSQTLTGTWWIYSDAGVHVTADLTKLTNEQGMAYVIPSAPGPYSGDHPPNEMSTVAGNASISGATTILAALSGGKRYRIFRITCAINSTSSYSNFYDSISGASIFQSSSIPTSHEYGPSGQPLSTGAALMLTDNYASGTMFWIVTYTIETV